MRGHAGSQALEIVAAHVPKWARRASTGQMKLRMTSLGWPRRACPNPRSPRSRVRARTLRGATLSILLTVAGVAASTSSAHAESQPQEVRPRTVAVGLVVGHNDGGRGQKPLRYAESDAKRVAAVLSELGGFDGTKLEVLAHPSSSRLMQSLDKTIARAKAAQARGEQVVLVFYYSGHARSNAINLGQDEVSLAALRAKLDGAPATLRLVVLDACQSGAFARTKGAEPASDFSFFSVSRLTSHGTAVMASSAPEELSQESDTLRGSFFTHHLVVGLRGAGDDNRDGRVSLDEAYRYAYSRTLAATSRTRVGAQHVTLQTDLAGQGDVAVTYPRAARSHLEVPKHVEGRLIVMHVPSGSVMAELSKAKGAPIVLALPAGHYEAILRTRGRSFECRMHLADQRMTHFDQSLCRETHEAALAKGRDVDVDDRLREIDRWEFELGAGAIWRQDSAYTDRLAEFNYRTDRGFLQDLPSGRLSLGATRRLVQHLSLSLQFAKLAGDSYKRELGNEKDSVGLSTYGSGLFLRADTDLLGAQNAASPKLGVYAQAGGGLAIGSMALATRSATGPVESGDVQVGPWLGGGVGATVAMPRVVTFYVQGGYERATAVTNLLGESYDGGGPSLVLGARLRFGGR